MSMYQSALEKGGQVTTTTTNVSTKVDHALSTLLSTNVLHLAGIVALVVLLALQRGPATAEWSSLALLVGLGINTSTGNTGATTSSSS